MYPKLYSFKIDWLEGETAWIIFIISAVFVFAFQYLANLEKKKTKDGKSKLSVLFNILFYIALLPLMILFLRVIMDQKILDLNSYGFMLAVVFIIGMYLALRKARQSGIPEQPILDLSLWGLLFAMLGARLFFMFLEYHNHNLEPPYAFFNDPSSFLNIDSGGLVAYGGFITGTLFSIIYIKKKKLPLGRVADILAPTLALGVGFARMGCNLAGCCWGGIADSANPIAIPLSLFDVSGFAKSDLPTYSYFFNYFVVTLGIEPAKALEKIGTTYIWPAQLISSVNGFVMFIVLSFIYKYHERFKFNGFLFLIFMMYYSVTRFLIEYIRVDTPKEFFGFSAGQFTGVLIFSLSLILIIYNYIRASKKSIKTL